jgi:uncharacterized protein YggE
MKIFTLLLIALVYTNGVRADDKPSLVSVWGRCLRSTTPDRGSVTLIIQQEHSDVKVATKNATMQYEQSLDAAKALKLADASYETNNLEVTPMDDWVQGKRVHRGYRARFAFTVTTTDLSRLGDLIALGGRFKVQQIEGPEQFLSPGKQKSEYESCLEEAVNNARDKAKKLVSAGGAKLGKIYSVSERGSSGIPHRSSRKLSMVMEDEDGMAAHSAPSIEVQKNIMTVDVDVSFEIN